MILLTDVCFHISGWSKLFNLEPEYLYMIGVGNSSLVNVKINGKYEVTEVKINLDDSIEKDDADMLEDMVLLAMNDALKKIASDKEKKMGKYGSGLSGLF